MRRPILREILLGLSVLFGVSTIFLGWLSNNYIDSTLDIEVDKFFVSTSSSYSENEAKFTNRLENIKNFIAEKIIKHTPKLSVRINQAFYSQNNIPKKVNRIATFFLHKRLLEVRKKFPYLANESLLTFEYIDLHKFWKNYRGNYLKQYEIDKNIQSVSTSSLKGKYSLANILASIYTKRVMGNKNVEYFFDSIKSMHGIQFDLSKSNFQTIEVLGARREFLILGLILENALKNKIISYQKISSNLKTVEPYMGFVACKLNLIDLYEKLPNVHSNLSMRLKSFTRFEILNAANQTTGKIFKLNQLENLLQSSQGSLRLRAYDFENREFYINVIKESRYNKYFHIFIYEAHAHYALYQEELRHYLIFYLLVVISIIIIAIGIASGLASPLIELSTLVQQASENLKTESLSNMNPKFTEIFVLKRVFTSQIDNLRHEFMMSTKLVDYQEFLLSRPEPSDAKNKLIQLLDELYDEENRIDGSKIIYSNNSDNIEIDNDFYLEWCRYHDSLILEKDYRTATQQKKEFRLAQDIQHQLLPTQDLLSQDVHCYYLAARYLGGDFYDLLKVGSQTYFLIADVSGKGLPSALFGAAAKFFLSVQLKANKSLEYTMKITNYYLCGLQQQGFFCTLFLASWEPNSRTLNYCSAGHNKMYLLTPEIQELNAKGLPLGFMDIANYKMGQISDVPENSLLVLYTDGVTEAENEDQELFDNLRLEELLLDNSSKSPSKISDVLINSLTDFTKDAEQSDDITYVLARL